MRENEVRRVRSQLEPLFQGLYLRWQKVWILRLVPEKWRRAILIRDHVNHAVIRVDGKVCCITKEELGRQPHPGIDAALGGEIVVAAPALPGPGPVEMFGCGLNAAVFRFVDHIAAMKENGLVADLDICRIQR